MTLRSRHSLLAAVLVVYGIALLLVAFWPVHVDRDARGALSELETWFASHGLAWVNYGLIEWGANVLWFAPLGLLLTAYWGASRWWVAVVVGVAASVIIELGQTFFLPGRTGSALDVLANGLGTLLGALIAVAVLRRARHSTHPVAPAPSAG